MATSITLALVLSGLSAVAARPSIYRKQPWFADAAGCGGYTYKPSKELYTRFSAGYDASKVFNTSILSDISGNQPWLGIAPWAFDQALVSTSDDGLTLEAKYRDGADGYTFPVDDSCGCEYFDHTTSMVATHTSHGYGYYETMLRSNASGLVNGFWMQGATTELNALRVDENGEAHFSYYCYADPSNMETFERKIRGPTIDLSDDTTVGLLFRQNTIKVFVNGRKRFETTTPSCLVGAQMRVMYSVEGGESSLPDVAGLATGASLGAMHVTYLRKFHARLDTSEGGMATKSCKIKKKKMVLKFPGTNCDLLTVNDKDAIANATEARILSATGQASTVTVACKSSRRARRDTVTNADAVLDDPAIDDADLSAIINQTTSSINASIANGEEFVTLPDTAVTIAPDTTDVVAEDVVEEFEDPPTDSPSSSPTLAPTAPPSVSPTAAPTADPTPSPTPGPTANPTPGPTPNPTSNPTSLPTGQPTQLPTGQPTRFPTKLPTQLPTVSACSASFADGQCKRRRGDRRIVP